MRTLREASTHIGTCQICGAQQKLPSGRLAYHGYTIQFGFFSGICLGSQNLPYEESRDLIPDFIKKCEDGLKTNKKRIDVLKNQTDNKVNVIVNRNLYSGYIEKTDQLYFVYKDRGLEKREKIHSLGLYETDVDEVAKKLRDIEIYRYESENKQIKKTIKYMQDRYDTWEPKETKQ